MPQDNRTIIYDHDDEDWRAVAACRGMDPDYFHPERGADTNGPKRICFKCPVKADCLIEALKHPDDLGIWGMTSERQRRFMRKKIAQNPEMSIRDFVYGLPGYGYPKEKNPK